MCVQWYFAEYLLELSLSFFLKVQKSYFGGIARLLERVNENEQIMRSDDSTVNIQKQQPGVFYKKKTFTKTLQNLQEKPCQSLSLKRLIFCYCHTRNRTIAPGQLPPKTIAPGQLPPGNCPPYNYPPDNSHLGKLSPGNCTWTVSP